MEKCGEKCEVYSRVTGYFRPVANWNKGKQQEFRDRKTFRVAGATVAILALLMCFCVSGCGHNAITYGDGVMLETTINPENYAFGISFRYGKILTACVRENTELEMEGAGSGNAATGSDTAKSGNTGANSTGKVKFKIGRQITGYYVDSIKAGVKPKQLDEYTGEKPKTPSDEKAAADKKASQTTGDAAKTEAVTPTAEAAVK